MCIRDSSYNNLLITDSLTGVYNRRFLDEKFLPSLKCCHDKKIIIGVCVMDFDDFKLVNDTYGHQAGDKLLKEAACFWKQNFNSRKKMCIRDRCRSIHHQGILIVV